MLLFQVFGSAHGGAGFARRRAQICSQEGTNSPWQGHPLKGSDVSLDVRYGFNFQISFECAADCEM